MSSLVLIHGQQRDFRQTPTRRVQWRQTNNSEIKARLLRRCSTIILLWNCCQCFQFISRRLTGLLTATQIRWLVILILLREKHYLVKHRQYRWCPQGGDRVTRLSCISMGLLMTVFFSIIDLFMAGIFTGHGWKNTGEINFINDGPIPLKVHYATFLRAC